MIDEAAPKPSTGDVAQQDALSNAFLGMFSVAVILIAQLGIGGIERRVFDFTYGRDAATAKHALLTMSVDPIPACVIGRKRDFSGVAYVLVEGRAELVPQQLGAFAPRSWLEEEDPPGRRKRRFFRIDSNNGQTVQSWTVRALDTTPISVWMFVDDRRLRLRSSELPAQTTWSVTAGPMARGFLVTEGACPP